MIFYKLTYQRPTNPADPDAGSTTAREWFTSDRAAKSRRTDMVDKGHIRSRNDASVLRVDVPTRGADLVEWLNIHCK